MSMNLSMVRGDTAVFTVTISSLPSSGLTGCTLYFTAKRDVSDPDTSKVFQKSSGSGIAVTTVGSDTVPGVASVTVSPSDTSGLPAYTQSLAWDCVLVDGSGNHTTVASGLLVVSPDVYAGN